MKPAADSNPLGAELLRRVVASSPDCIKVLDLQGNLVSMNEGGQEALGIVNLTPHLGTCWTGWWEDTEFYKDAQRAVQAARQGATGHFEAHAKNFGGAFKWWDVTVSPIMGADGKPEQLLSVSRDITRRKLAEQEVAEMHQKNHARAEAERARILDVFKRSPSFMAVLRGPSHVFEMVNDRYYQIVGHRDILGRSVLEAIPEVAGQGFIELLDKVYATGEPFVGKDMLFMVQRAPGHALEESFLDLVYQPTFAADGSIDGILAHGVDMTEQHVSAARLRQVSEQRGLALDSAQMGWWHYDPATGIVEWDERAQALYGVSADQVSYERFLATIHPEDLPRRNATYQAATDPDGPHSRYETEYRVAGPAGTWRWLQVRGKVTFAEAGAQCRFTGVDGTVVDVTAAKEAQAALLRNEQQFRQLADAMPQIVWAARPDGVVDYYNQRWYDYTGTRPVSEASNATWEQVVNEEDERHIYAVWNESIRTGQPYEAEYRIRRASDGTFRWHLGRAVPIHDESGKIVRWYGTNTDIHERKELQHRNEELLESERTARAQVEHTSQMKDEFLATLSHELRTPLNAIVGWTHLLRSPRIQQSDLTEGLAVIERNAQAQAQIIEDLLDMSKIISGKVGLDARTLRLDEVIGGAVETMRPTALTKGVRLQALIDPEAGTVLGDPNRLQQVFWNLLSNAIKFTPKAGKVQVILEQADACLMVSITDTGEGIAPEFLPYVFDRFRQQDASTTRRHGGLGLGLAIVKQLVELHGGSIGVQSAGLGQGTTFRVQLPISEAPATPTQTTVGVERRELQMEGSASSVPAGLLDLAGTKVLVVDDEVDAQTFVKRLLEEHQATVLTAGTVAEALALLRTERPDILVSDIGMPGEDGYALIRQVRALTLTEGGGTPAVALTAYARAEDRLKAVSAGFQTHVSKPVNSVELLALVASLIKRPEGR